MKKRLLKTITVLSMMIMFLASFSVKGITADYETLQPGAGYPIENYKYSTARFTKKAESWVYNTSLQILQGNGKTINGYCFANFQWDQTGQIMRLISIEEYMAKFRAEYLQSHAAVRDGVPEEIDLDKIRAIAMNSRLTKSLGEIRNITGISSLTEEEATKAAQLAIWHYTDGLKTKPYNSSRDYAYYDYYLNYPTKTWWGKTTYTDLQTLMTVNETKYYNYLINLPGIPKPAEQVNLILQPTVTYPDENTAEIKYDYLEGIGEPVITFDSDPNKSYSYTEETKDGRVYATVRVNINENDKFCVEATGKEVWDIAIMSGSNQPKVVVIPQQTKKKVCVDIKKPQVPKADLIIEKKDFDSQLLLAGAEFSLRDRDGIQLQTAVSDSNGQVVFTELKPGSYTIVETKAPENYQENAEKYEIEVINENGKAVVYFNNEAIDRLDIYNKKNLFELNINKVNGDNLIGINGAVFELRDENNEIVGTETSQNRGKIKFTDLPPGTYYLTETFVPIPYILPSGNLVVTIDGEGNISVSGELSRRATVRNNILTFRNYNRIF